jgi:hypothetical protein
LVYETVAILVCHYFFSPEIAVADWRLERARVAMPKIAIHKNGDSFPAEHKVRPSGDFLISAPPVDSVLPHQRNQSEFGAPVSPALDQ